MKPLLLGQQMVARWSCKINGDEKTNITEMKSSEEVFPWSEHTTAVFQRWPGLYLELAAELGSLRVTHVVLVLKARRGHEEQLRSGTMWQDSNCWRDSESIITVAELPNILKVPIPWHKNSSSREVELRRHAVFPAEETRNMTPLKELQKTEWIPDFGNWVVYS